METRKVAVIAIGGNSLVNKGRESIEDQYQAVMETARHIADMIQSGWTVAVGHGTGPQGGFVLWVELNKKNPARPGRGAA